MNRLECCVSTCANNQCGLCRRPAIKVQGQSSVNSADTRCQSFWPQGNSVTDSVSDSPAEPDTDIYCTACNCVYNDESCHKCTASNVEIDGDGAHTMSGTQCGTFSCKDGCGC